MHMNDKHRTNRRIRRVAALAAGVWLLALLPWLVVPALAIGCPGNGTLTEASITPGSGTTATLFKFSVRYSDAEGQAPQRVWARYQGGPDIVNLTGSGNLVPPSYVTYTGSS